MSFSLLKLLVVLNTYINNLACSCSNNYKYTTFNVIQAIFLQLFMKALKTRRNLIKIKIYYCPLYILCNVYTCTPFQPSLRLFCTLPILSIQTSLNSLFCLHAYYNLINIPSVLNCARNNSLFSKY